MNFINVKSNGKNYRLPIRDDADASVAAEIFKEREYRLAEPIIALASGPVLDIGAHAGFFTLYARSLNSSVKIFAVEPEPNNFELLKKTLAENNIENVEVVKAALSSKTGNRKLKITVDSHNHRLLSPGESEVSGESISVYTYSLSDLMKKCIINNVSLLKLDIEEGEYEAFESITADNLQKIGAIIMEYHLRGGRKLEKIEIKLRESKFGVQVFPSRFDKTMGFLFAKSKR